jgi:hypothetical protein
MIVLLFAGLLAAASPSPSPQDAPAATATRGVPGVCIRWERRRRSRVAEAVVVRSAGNTGLDERVARAIPDLDWPVGVDDYRGQWVGVWMAVGGAQAPAETVPLPDCSALPDHSWPQAPAAGS